MNLFKENYCRVCKQFFCCSTCRLKHEEKYHKINPECDICIYGRAILKDISQSLSEHLQTQHFPLHCVYCKKVFSNMEELKLSCKCSKVAEQVEQINVIKTQASCADLNYDSPPITVATCKSILTSSNKYFGSNHNDIGSYVTTSTPMQKAGDLKLINNIPEEITPVDYSGNTYNTDKSESNRLMKSGTTPNSEHIQSGEQLIKRVTFSLTPIIGSHNTASSEDHLVLKKKDSLGDNIENKVEVMGTSVSIKQLKCYKVVSCDKQNISQSSEFMNNTTWESAVMETTHSQIQAQIMNNSEILSPILAPNSKEADVLPSDIKYMDLVSHSLNDNTNLIEKENLQDGPCDVELRKDSLEENIHVAGSSQKSGLVSLLINIIRTVVPSFPGSKPHQDSSTCVSQQFNLSLLQKSTSYKRLKPETETIEEIPSKKRIRLNNIQCRRSIRDLTPFTGTKYKRKTIIRVDKSTQTD